MEPSRKGQAMCVQETNLAKGVGEGRDKNNNNNNITKILETKDNNITKSNNNHNQHNTCRIK